MILAVSNGNKIIDLAGPFANSSATIGNGYAGTVDLFSGPGSQGQLVTGAGVTLGGGAGAGYLIGGSTTEVTPLVNNSPKSPTDVIGKPTSKPNTKTNIDPVDYHGSSGHIIPNSFIFYAPNMTNSGNGRDGHSAYKSGDGTDGTVLVLAPFVVSSGPRSGGNETTNGGRSNGGSIGSGAGSSGGGDSGGGGSGFWGTIVNFFKKLVG